MSTNNVVPIGGGERKSDGDDSYIRKNEVLVMIDKARGVVETVSLVLMNQGDAGVVLQAHCACALDLANEELQRVRDACEVAGV